MSTVFPSRAQTVASEAEPSQSKEQSETVSSYPQRRDSSARSLSLSERHFSASNIALSVARGLVVGTLWDSAASNALFKTLPWMTMAGAIAGLVQPLVMGHVCQSSQQDEGMHSPLFDHEKGTVTYNGDTRTNEVTLDEGDV